MLRMWTVFVVLLTLAARFTATDNEGEKVYLHQLTIYKTHESRFCFFGCTPDVYLSCNDGLPSVALEQVTRTDEVYTFEVGAQPTTQLGGDGCVTCRLMERDFFSADDLFGEWKMCFDDFKETGSHEVVVKGEFKAFFECPVCKYVEPPLTPPEQPPQPPPEQPPEEPPEQPPEEPPEEPPEQPPEEPLEVEGTGAEAPSVEGSRVSVGSQSSSESVSDSDYDEIIDEMIRIDMEDLTDLYSEAKAQ